MKAKFKSIGKKTFMTAAEVGVIGGGMIITKKFLDARTIFAKQIEKDPSFAEKYFVKHQGAVKLIAGGAAATMVKNPWLKLVFIGVALEGFISEARTLSTNKTTGVALFESIGAEKTDIDREMLEAARAVRGGDDMSGDGDISGDEDMSGEIDNFPQTAVSGKGSFGDEYGTTVSGGSFSEPGNTMVSGFDDY